MLEVELQDQTAPAEWFLNDKPITEDGRIEIKNLGGGKHQLVFTKLEMGDEGEITCKSGVLSSSCKLTVKKGESKPIIIGPDRVDAPISKPITFEVPYKSELLRFHLAQIHSFFIHSCFLISVDGTRTSQVEAKLVKDGKVLPLKEVEVVVLEEKITYKIKKPTRALSGNYELKLSNAQGEESKTIPINMQGRGRGEDALESN